jgi:hypothetical protein
VVLALALSDSLEVKIRTKKFGLCKVVDCKEGGGGFGRKRNLLTVHETDFWGVRESKGGSAGGYINIETPFSGHRLAIISIAG